MSFSALNRIELRKKLETETFDLLVIGGGATGCGIALDAASRGIKTALVEKKDYAAGTSGRSTKLIHGGLRYLKQLDVALVRETGTERAIVHQLAPHLVLPKKMLMPLVKGGNYGYWSTAFGLWIYDVLAGVTGDDKRKMLSAKQTLELEPLLYSEGLTGGGLYAEYRTDDARLTIELIKTAARYGATVVNYCKVVNFVYRNGEIKGVNCRDEAKGNNFEIKAKKIVWAGGPWVDGLRGKDNTYFEKRLHLTKGVHIVFSRDKIPVNYTTYFDGPDGRMIFAVPRGNTTYIGTTDTDYTGDIERPITTKADADYLLSAVKYVFPTVKISRTDILSSWAGLRPLIHEKGKSPSELSRKDEIFVSDSGLISIAGGKLTGYRKMAQRVVDLVVKKLCFEKRGKQKLLFKKCRTENIPLAEKPFKNWSAVLEYISKLKKEFVAIGLDTERANYLVQTYGRDSEVILKKMKDFDTTLEIALVRAELWYCVQYEQVQALDDFLVRRTGRLYFDIDSISEIRKIVLNDLKSYLNWNDEKANTENRNLDDLIFDATNFYDDEFAAS